MSVMNRVPITPKIRTELHRLKKETGVGATRLLKEAENLPTGLTVHVLIHCMKVENSSLTEEQLKWVLQTWRKVTRRVTLTPAIKKSIIEERERTRMGNNLIFKTIKNVPKGLNVSSFQAFVNGRCKTIRQDHLDAVMNAYANISDTNEHRVYDESRALISDEIREELLSLQAETGLKPARLMRGAPKRPKGLNSDIIKGWLTGNGKTADKEFLAYVQDLWRSHTISVKNGEIVSPTGKFIMTPEVRERLIACKKNSGMSLSQLLKNHADKPKNLTSYEIRLWMNGNNTRVHVDHLNWVLKYWENAPQLIRYSRILYAEITTEIKRTGASAYVVLSRGEDAPAGLTVGKLKRLMERSDEYVLQIHLDFLLRTLKNLPSPPRVGKESYLGRTVRKDGDINRPVLRHIADDERTEIEVHIARTGIYGADLLSMYVDSKPDSLNAGIIRNWRVGRQKNRSNAKLISWVLQKYRALPDNPLK